MRKSILIATIIGGVDAVYKLVIVPTSAGKDVNARQVLLFGGFLTLLAFLSFIEPLGDVIDVLSYTFVVIVVLNDGYDLVKTIGAL